MASVGQTSPSQPSSEQSSPFRSARLEKNSELLRQLVGRAASELDQTDQLLGSLISKIKTLKQSANVGTPGSPISLLSPDSRRRAHAGTSGSPLTAVDASAPSASATPSDQLAYNMKIRDLVQRVKDKNVQMQKLVDRVSTLEKEVFDKDQKVWWLHEKIRLLEEEAKNKDQDLFSLRAAWDSKLHAKDEQLALARSALANFERERSPDREAELQRVKELFQAELQAKDDQIAVLQLKLEALEKLHAEGSEAGRRQRQQHGEALVAKLRALEDEVRTRVMAASDLRRVLIPKLRRQNQLLDEWKARCSQLVDEAAAREAAAGAIGEKMRELEAEVERRVALEEQVARAVQESEGRAAALRRDLAAKEALAASLEARVRALEEALAEGGGREAALRARAGELEGEVAERKAAEDALRAAVGQLLAERELLKGEYERLCAAEAGFQSRIRGLEGAVASREDLIRAHQARARKLGERVGLLNAWVRQLKESGGPRPAEPAPPPPPSAAAAAPAPAPDPLPDPSPAEEEYDFEKFSPRSAFAPISRSNPFRSPLPHSEPVVPSRTPPSSASTRTAATAAYPTGDDVVHSATHFPAEPQRQRTSVGTAAGSPPPPNPKGGPAENNTSARAAAQAAAAAAAAAAANFPGVAAGNTTVCVIISRPGLESGDREKGEACLTRPGPPPPPPPPALEAPARPARSARQAFPVYCDEPEARPAAPRPYMEPTRKPQVQARAKSAPRPRAPPPPPPPLPAPVAADFEEIFMDGYMRRQDPISQRFVRRFFRLRVDRLSCYANERSEKPLSRTVLLSDVLAVTVLGSFDGRVCNFQISSRSGGAVVLQCDNRDELYGWVNAIRCRVRRLQLRTPAPSRRRSDEPAAEPEAEARPVAQPEPPQAPPPPARPATAAPRRALGEIRCRQAQAAPQASQAAGDKGRPAHAHAPAAAPEKGRQMGWARLADVRI